MLRERGELTAPHGQVALSAEIFQSLLIVPVLALIALLGSSATSASTHVGARQVIEIVAAFAGIYALGRYALPWALTRVARELGPAYFILIVIGGVFFAGWAMETIGISMGLGGFMVGILL